MKFPFRWIIYNNIFRGRAFSFLILLALFLQIAGCKKHSPVAHQGILDARKWDFNRDGAIPLEGEWEFHYKSFLEPDDFSNSNLSLQKLIVRQPGTWSKGLEEKLPAHGWGTMRLVVLTSGDITDWGLKVTYLFTGYKLFLNGKKILSNGQWNPAPGKSIPEWKPAVGFFNNSSGKIEIIIHVFNDSHPIGYSRPIVLGEKEQISYHWIKSISWNALLVGIILIIGIYHLIFYLLRKNETSAFFFSLICFSLAVRTFITGERLITQIFPMYSWIWMQKTAYVFLFIAIVAFVYFIYKLYPDINSRIYVYLIGSISFFLSLMVLFTDIRIFYYLVYVFFALFAVSITYITIILINAKMRQYMGSGLMLLSILVLVFTGIMDFLHDLRFHSLGSLTPIGLVVMLVMQAMVLARRFTQSFDMVEKLSHTLREAKENLEVIIKDRTMELETAYQSLDEAYNDIKNDLGMAKTIQRKILPSIRKINNFNIIIEYLPYIEVGGDIYDIRAKDPSRIRIFLADATGHGIVASLITMLIKNEYDNENKTDMDPFRILYNLNNTFCTKYLDLNVFFTAIIIDIDSAKNELVYASGGNPPACILGDDDIKILPHTCRAIGVMPDLAGQNVTMEFKEHNKILLFTDGLFEEFNSSDEEFGNDRLLVTIKKHRKKPVEQIIRLILNEVKNYIKPSGLFDDTTIIGLEKND